MANDVRFKIMAPRLNKLVHARLESLERGVVELARDWKSRTTPPVSFGDGVKWAHLARAPEHLYGFESGYFSPTEESVMFVCLPENHPELDLRQRKVYLSGDFNGWGGCGQEAWQLEVMVLGGRRVLVWSGAADDCATESGWSRFKFVTDEGCWLSVPMAAPNVDRDEAGNVNRRYDSTRTGRHMFQFELERPLNMARLPEVYWQGGDHHYAIPLMPGAFFYDLESDLPLGALVGSGETVFRVFAPRAERIELCLCDEIEAQHTAHRYVMARRVDAHGDAGVWEITLEQHLHGWFYWYQVSGQQNAFGVFDPEQRVLDPYALATVHRNGPGIILDPAWVGSGDLSFKTPAWHDLVIAEAHVRDLVAHAPVPLDDAERRGFSGLCKWVESDNFYLSQLGVNCVELQPVQEFDNLTTEEYHWGYMTSNFFSPESSYARHPEEASGVREFQQLVAAFHRRGIAVILDVVYNHVGEPAHLMFLDKLYYFHQDSQGNLSNWSGCGNDVRADAAMARRLIIDSCRHLITAYGVDGFRFDLADLIGRDVLVEIEAALKQTKPDVILIAEPWSFRGHIAGELLDTGWASWNDGYRNFMREFVRGHGNRVSFEYFLKGSPWHYAKWPAQTVNYTESHDDRAWIDVITENPDHDGHLSTANDRRRTHLMAAVLFSSIGIPMLSSGQDFLRSKFGANNTYQRGDLNALDYRRMQRFPGTHAYFADWIAFRRSTTGRLFRHFSRASDGFFKFIWGEDSPAVAVIYNADLSQGPERLLLALNPGLHDAHIPLGAIADLDWHQVADHEHFLHEATGRRGQCVEVELFVPALGCGLWQCPGK